MARSLGLAGEAVAAERSLAKQRACAEADVQTAAAGTCARAFQVSLCAQAWMSMLLLGSFRSESHLRMMAHEMSRYTIRAELMACSTSCT